MVHVDDIEPVEEKPRITGLTIKVQTTTKTAGWTLADLQHALRQIASDVGPDYHGRTVVGIESRLAAFWQIDLV